jgi:hypothetical protein
VDGAQILRELWRRKVWVVVVALLAAVAAVAMMYSIQPLPPKLTKKSTVYGVASVDVLVDVRRSALGDARLDLFNLAGRADVYARLVNSTRVKNDIARRLGTRATAISVQGPPPLQPQTQGQAEPSAQQRAQEIRGSDRPYRVYLDTEQSVPVISIFTQADTAPDALRLADATSASLEQYARDQNRSLNRIHKSGRKRKRVVPIAKQVTVHPVGVAEGGTISKGASKVAAVLAFIGVFLTGSLLIVVVASLARGWREAEARERLIAVGSRPLPGNPAERE